MNKEAQRTAIFRAQGFFLGAELGYNAEQASLWYRPDPEGTYHDLQTWTKKFSEVTTDPLNDLNAMHEAEKIISVERSEKYMDCLTDCLSLPINMCVTARGVFIVAHATAAQRAEAFLRTIGKWEGE